MPATTKRRRAPGPVPVRFGADERALLKRIEAHARAEKRSLSGQIKYYAALGMIAKDYPDLPLSMIEGILEGREEFRAGLAKPYEWGVIG
jgi:ParD-like antitoxin of type II bacterial toxin-antitoxin system